MADAAHGTKPTCPSIQSMKARQPTDGRARQPADLRAASGKIA